MIHLMDLPPADKNMGVALAITYDKQTEDSLYVSGSQAYTHRELTWDYSDDLRNCNLMPYNQNFNEIKQFVITRQNLDFRCCVSAAGKPLPQP